MKLLIAVKSETIRDFLALSLSMHDVHTCHTGADALAMLETLRPDIFLLDLSLPGMDGLSLLHVSRYKPAHILALTNLVSQTVLQVAADAGVQDIMRIPCSVRYILERLNTLIEKAPSAEG